MHSRELFSSKEHACFHAKKKTDKFKLKQEQ